MGVEPGKGLLTTQAEGPGFLLVREGRCPPGCAFTHLHACVYAFTRKTQPCAEWTKSWSLGPASGAEP